MKRSLIALVSLHAVAALAAATTRSPNAEIMVLKPDELDEKINEIKLNVATDKTAASHETVIGTPGNDEKFDLGYIPPIVTREMLSAEADKRPIHGHDLNPVSIIQRDSSGGGSQCLEGDSICIVPQVTTSRTSFAALA